MPYRVLRENALIAPRKRLPDSKHTANVQSQDLLTAAAAAVLTSVFMYTNNTNHNRVLSIHQWGKKYHRQTHVYLGY